MATPIQTQIHCKECGDGTLMVRKPGTPAYARYRCSRGHEKLLPKVIHIPVQRGGPRPPDNAA